MNYLYSLYIALLMLVNSLPIDGVCVFINRDEEEKLIKKTKEQIQDFYLVLLHRKEQNISIYEKLTKDLPTTLEDALQKRNSMFELALLDLPIQERIRRNDKSIHDLIIHLTPNNTKAREY